MGEILFNTSWMGFNLGLAFLAVIFGHIAFYTKHKFWQIIFGILWLLFLPNTLYIVTDIIHLPESLFEVTGIARIIILVQFILLELGGILSFFYALWPLEKKLQKLFPTSQLAITNSIIILNFILSIGLVMGRVERANSWEVLTKTKMIFYDSLHTLSSPQLVLYIFLFGVLGNGIYFSLKRFIFAK